MNIEDIIKHERKQKKLTQEELAQELFVSRQLISKWENNRSYPDLEQLIKLSDFFNISLDELMRGDKKMTKKLNFSLKNKNIFYMIMGVLTLIIISLTYFLLSEQTVQLTPEDIEVVSISTSPITDRKVFDEDTNEYILIPSDVSYTIQYKIKKPFTNLLTGYYFESLETDPDNLYVDIRGSRTLFKSNKVHTMVIPAASSFKENEISDASSLSTLINNKNKNIKIINPSKFNAENPTIDQSWLFIDKKQLE